MSQIRNANVLITGGASGIGKLMGLKCLQEGAANLIIWDINAAAIQKTEKEFIDKGYKNIHTFLVDVANVDNIEKSATEVLLEIGNIDILFNNAGIVAGKKYFWEHSAKDISATLDINVSGVMNVTRVFINEMIKQGKGHIINIASASSFISLPRGSVYASSKWAVFGWSESLRMEFEQAQNGLRVTTVCPGYIDSELFKGVKAPILFPLLQEEEVASKTIKAIKENETVLLLPDNLHIVPVLKGVFPTKIFDILAGFLGVYNSMESFKGKQQETPASGKKIKVK